MTISKIIFAAALALGASSVFAEDGVIKQDQQRVHQDHMDVKADKGNIKTAKDKMAADAAAGDTADAQKDKDALKEARRNKAEDKKRMMKDKTQKLHDEKHP